MKYIKDRILIVENNPDISDFLANQALVSPNYEIFQVADANSAITQAIQINPDLIISDINLPGLNGKDLLIALASHKINPPTIMIARAGQEAEIIQAFRIGASDYISWPARETEIVLVVERLLRRVQERREHLDLENKLRVTNQQLQQRVKELSAIFNIGKAVTSITNHKILFEKILRITAQSSQSDLGWLLIRQEEKGKNFLLVSQYNLPDILNSKIQQVWDDGISQLVAISGETLNISGEPINRFKVKVFGESIIIIPVKIQRQVMGLLVLMRKNKKPYNQSEQRLLEAAADYASISLVNARLFRSYEARENALTNLVTHSQINEKIINELLSKTKESLVNFSSESEKNWDTIINSFEDDEQSEYTDQIKSLSNVVTEIHNLSNLLHSEPFVLKTNQKELFDLIIMVKDIIQHLQPTLDFYNISLKTDFSIESAHISADPTHIYESLIGIMVNAIQFCELEGSIFIKSSRDLNSNIVLSISNTGLLLEINKNSSLTSDFQIEKQPKIRFGGVGISLLLVAKIISQYNGNIWMQDHPELGTTITISLPISE